GEREGSLWIGLHGTGLMRWLGYHEWESWTKGEGLSSDMIWAIRPDASGRLWAGTENGLNEMEPQKGQWITWRQHQEMHGMKVRAVAAGRDGEMWAGANPGGIFRFNRNGKLIATYGARDGLTSDNIWGLLVDAEGAVWAGTTGGLFQSEKTDSRYPRRLHFKRVAVPFSDANENMYQPMVDSRGWLWVPGSRGLACLRNGQWKRYLVEDGLKSNATYNVADASDGSIWVAYAEPFGVSRMVFHGDQ